MLRKSDAAKLRVTATASMESESNTFSNPKTDIYP